MNRWRSARHDPATPILSRSLSRRGDEGARAGRELRDAIAPRLADLAIELGDIRARVTTHPLESERRLANTVREIIDLTDSIQTLSRALDPSTVLHVGLDESLRHETTLFADREGVPVHYRGAHDLPDVATNVVLTFFRVAQTALRYVTQDGQATTVDVDLAMADQQLCLTVRSDAAGLMEPGGHDPGAVATMSHWDDLHRWTADGGGRCDRGDDGGSVSPTRGDEAQAMGPRDKGRAVAASVCVDRNREGVSVCPE